MTFRSGSLILMYSVYMFEKGITIITLAAAIVLGGMLQSTNPSSIGPVGILAVFFCIYIVAVGLISWSLYVISHVLSRFVVKRKSIGIFSSLSMRRSYYFASIIALGPVILLAMGSVGRLGMYEFILVGALILIGLFYVQKRA